MHAEIEVIDVNPDLRTGRRRFIVRVGGETIGAFDSLQEALKYFAVPTNRSALKKKSLPGSASRSHLVRTFGKSGKHAVLAVLDEDGKVLYHIIVTPGTTTPVPTRSKPRLSSRRRWQPTTMTRSEPIQVLETRLETYS